MARLNELIIFTRRVTFILIKNWISAIPTSLYSFYSRYFPSIEKQTIINILYLLFQQIIFLHDDYVQYNIYKKFGAYNEQWCV